MSSGNLKPVVLAIGGLDPSGGAGIIADVSAIAAAGCKPAAAVTSMTFQNSDKVAGAEHLTADAVCRQVHAVLGEHNVAAVKTGMLPTAEIAQLVAGIVAKRSLANLVIDPVLRSTSGYELIDKAALDVLLSDLLPLATLITPNVPEIESITGISIENIDDIRAAADILHKQGAGNILLKGGHLPPSINTDAKGKRVSSDFLFENGQMTVLAGEFIPSANVRGTGCMLASSIAAYLASGDLLAEAVRRAKEFVYRIIRAA